MGKHLSRVTILTAVLVVWAVLVPGAGLAAEQKGKPVPVVQLLFVQNAKGVAFDKETLTLKGVSPTTIFFSDRPVRLAGHFSLEEFLQLWDEGKDSFLADPPNATVSIFEKGKEDLVDVVVKLSNPRLNGEDLTYNIQVLEGQGPAAGGECSVFIDIIGLPWTPLSYAGVARRWTRRAVLFGGAATSAAAATAIATTPAVVVPPATVTVTTTAPPPSPPPQPTAEQKLQELKSMLNQGLITQS